MEILGPKATRRAALRAAGGGGLLTALTITAGPAAADTEWEKHRDKATTRPAPNPNAIRPVLKLGASGAYVKAAQDRLNALRYWCGTADGNFGHLTQQAVWALQKANSVTRSGTIDATAWDLLDRGAKPKARSTSGTVIEIDLKRQLLICVIGGVVQWSFNTSTGNGERYYSRGMWRTAYTPTGSFAIYRRYTSGWQEGPLGAMWKPAYWKSGWAIHGSTSIPPYPASHGCCRVSTAGMDLLYRLGWPAMARKVWVY